MTSNMVDFALQNPQLVQMGIQAMSGANNNNGNNNGANYDNSNNNNANYDNGNNNNMNSGNYGNNRNISTSQFAMGTMNNMNNGMSMSDSASQVAMMSGNPEVAVGIQAAKWYGKWNGIYTIIIIIFLLIFTWWVFAGMLSGSQMSAEAGWDLFTCNQCKDCATCNC